MYIWRLAHAFDCATRPRWKYICASKQDNGLSPVRCKAITWKNTCCIVIGRLRIHFSDILIIIQTFSCKEIYLNMSSVEAILFWPQYVNGVLCILRVGCGSLGQYYVWWYQSPISQGFLSSWSSYETQNTCCYIICNQVMSPPLFCTW